MISPFDTFLASDQIEPRVFKILKAPRLFRIGRILKFLEKLPYANVMRILKLYVFFFVVAHWVGCFWVIVEDAPEYQEWSFGKLYAYCLLQGMLLLTKNPLDTSNNTSFIFQVTVMFLATCYTAMLFGNMVVLIDNLDQAQDFYKAKMDLINEHMRYMQLPNNL